jgi:hypothetical protein
MERLFISYNKADEAWAEWAAWIFQETGYQVTIQGWHFLPGHNFVYKMNQALAQSDRASSCCRPSR